MKYIDLIDPQNLISPELHKCFTDNSNFIYFHPWRIQSALRKKIDTNWKARISIHPEDMNKAWEIILPFLCQKNMSFKIANPNVMEGFKKGRQEKLERLIEEYNQFLQSSNSQDKTFLRNTFHRIYQQLGLYRRSEWRLISFIQTYLTKMSSFFNQYNLNREKLLEYTKNIYENLIDLRKQKLKNASRLYEGMQFTIYILPGLEKECQHTLEEIEENLIKAEIRPGIIFPTDRQIGVYSSIRHPGKWYYHNATDVNLETYNPDNISDPFSFLKTVPAKEIMQKDEIQTIMGHRDSAQHIISALRAKKFIPPSQLKALAVHKEDVLKHIKTSSLEIRKKSITDCLDKSSNLGKFFRVQRGLFSPKLSHGTLKQLELIRLTMS